MQAKGRCTGEMKTEALEMITDVISKSDSQLTLGFADKAKREWWSCHHSLCLFPQAE